MAGDRFAWALAVACPACAASVVLVPFALLGIGAAAAKSILAGAVLLLVAGAWAVNAWRRRGEGCSVPMGD
jgi:hypothetical protein